MNGYQAGRFAFVLAQNARVAGMTAENMQRQALGQSMAYNEQDFASIAHNIDTIAYEILNAG